MCNNRSKSREWGHHNCGIRGEGGWLEFGRRFAGRKMRARPTVFAVLWVIFTYNLRDCIYERFVHRHGQAPAAGAVSKSSVPPAKSVTHAECLESCYTAHEKATWGERCGWDTRACSACPECTMDGVAAVSPPSAQSNGAAVSVAADPPQSVQSLAAATPPHQHIVVTPGGPSWGADRLAYKLAAASATQKTIAELLQKPPNANGFVVVPGGDVCNQDLARASSVAGVPTECAQNAQCSGYVLVGSPPDAAWMKSGEIKLSSITLSEAIAKSRNWPQLYIKGSLAAKAASTVVAQDSQTRCSFHSQAEHYNDQALFSLFGGTTTGSKEECHCASFTLGCPCVIPPTLVGADHVCVEIGAHNGIDISNTLWFEEKLKWRSLLVEANPVTFKQLVRNRPNAEKVNGIISTQKGDFTFFSFDDTADGTQRGWANTMSGMKGSNAETRDEPTARAYAATVDATLGVHSVPSFTFAEVFKQKNISRIEFISVDVEGAEFNVIETIDFTQVSVRYVMFEGADIKVKNLLTKAGFVEKSGDKAGGLGGFDTLYENVQFS